MPICQILFQKNFNVELRTLSNQNQRAFLRSSQIFLTLNLPTYLNYYIYQSETIPRRSMYPIRPQFKLCSFDSSLSSSFQKQDLLSVLPTSLPGQTINPNEYVGGDAGEYSALDSTFSKHTKCTNGSQSSFLQDNEDRFFVIDTPKKSQRKQLKKEMKKQKIKRKQQEKKNLNLKIFQKVNFYEASPVLQQSCLVQKSSEKKNLENSFYEHSLSYKIQKLTQQTFANPTPQKKIHTENSSAPSKVHLPYLSLLQLEQVKVLLHNQEDIKLKQNLFLEQTRIQQEVLQNSKIQIQPFENYFINDLKQEALQKLSRKSNKLRNYLKLSFLQNMMDHSANYQLPIQNAKPKDNEIEKIKLERKVSDLGKKTLLIDLDDTLIFTSKPLQASQLKSDDFKITQNDGKCRKLYIRPHAREFLQRMSKFYQIIIFTAATNCYAQQIRKILDPKNSIISHLLDRKFCFNPNKSSSENKLPFIKDLRKLDRSLSETILLDNSIYCFWYQINNGVPIISYNKEDKNDKQLLKVEQYLLKLTREKDVRQKNKEYFKLEQYEQHVDALTLVEQLYIQEE